MLERGPPSECEGLEDTPRVPSKMLEIGNGRSKETRRLFVVLFLRQSLREHRLVLNSRSSCLSFLGIGLIDVSHHAGEETDV